MTGSNSRSAWWTAGLGATLALLLTLALTAATAAASDRCAKGRGDTVAVNGAARVYTVDGADGHTLLYGCARPTGRRRLLADAFDDDYVTSATFEQIRLRGHMVAFATATNDISCKANCPPGYQPYRTGIEVHDLRRARLVRVVADAVPLDLAVTTRGGVAWTRPTDTADVVEVRAADSWGRRTLDRGRIAGRSLTAELTIVSWLRDGVERFARLR